MHDLLETQQRFVPKIELARGQRIFSEGDLGEELFIIVNGMVDIYANKRLITTLGKNDIFGEMALIDGGPRSATAIAKTKSILIAVSKRDFLTLVRRDPEFAIDVMRTLTRRLRRMNLIF